jgi:hypothetical protein
MSSAGSSLPKRGLISTTSPSGTSATVSGAPEKLDSGSPLRGVRNDEVGVFARSPE